MFCLHLLNEYRTVSVCIKQGANAPSLTLTEGLAFVVSS